jgi:hypothetical protein
MTIPIGARGVCRTMKRRLALHVRRERVRGEVMIEGNVLLKKDYDVLDGRGRREFFCIGLRVEGGYGTE